MNKAGTSFLTKIYYSWQFRYTQPGRLLFFGIFFSGVVGSVTVSIPIYHLFIGLILGYAVSFTAGALFHPRVTMTAKIPETITAGETAVCSFHLTNRSRLPAYDVSVGIFGLPSFLKQTAYDATVPVLPPGSETTVTARIATARRGRYALPDARSYTTFPFNLHRIPGASCPLRSLLVLPKYYQLESVGLPAVQKYQPGGIAYASHIGESLEYAGNRDYRPGDPMRRLDFRSWARLTRPVVREYKEEYYTRLALVLDTHLARGLRRRPRGDPQLESGISLTASVVEYLSRREYVVDLFAAGCDLHFLRTGRSTSYFEHILEILATVEECTRNPFEVITPAIAQEIGRFSGILSILLDWDETRREFVRTMNELSGNCTVCIVRDGATSLPVETYDSRTVRFVFLEPGAIMRGEINSI